MPVAGKAHWAFHSGDDVTSRNASNDWVVAGFFHSTCPWCSCWMV